MIPQPVNPGVAYVLRVLVDLIREETRVAV